MLEILTGLPAKVVGVKAVGTVSKDDYLNVMEPLLDQARSEGRRLRFLYQFGPEFDHFSPGGVWEDTRLGFSSMRLFEGCAIVTDVGWLRQAVNFASVLMPCPVRVFDNDQLDAAAAWLETLPQGGHLTHRLDTDLGVLVIEPHGPLRAADFDTLSLVVDPWIAKHGELHGLVVHTENFPGWDKLASVLRHIRFIHDHHRKIGRIALVADTKLADLAPQVTEHFVRAELRHFPYDQLEQAIAWAAEGHPRAKP